MAPHFRIPHTGEPLLLTVVLYPSGVLGQKKRLRSIGLNDLFVLKYNYGMSSNIERIYCKLLHTFQLS